MGIGLGIVLLLIGLILGLQIVNWPAGVDKVISETGQETLGWIFVVVGIIAIVLALVMNQQRTRSTAVVEERRDPRPPV